MGTFNAHIAYPPRFSRFSFTKIFPFFVCHNALLHCGYTYIPWALHSNGFSQEWSCVCVHVFVHALSIRVYKINRIIVRHIYFLCNIRPFARRWYQTTATTTPLPPPLPTDEIKRSPRMHKNHKGRLIRVWTVNCTLLASNFHTPAQPQVCKIYPFAQTNKSAHTHRICTITHTRLAQNKRRSRNRR